MQTKSAYIGLVNPKSPTNVGMVLRAAGCYEADAIYYSGERFNRARKFSTDTKNVQGKIPLNHIERLQDANVNGAVLVAIELVEGATPLMDFVHPQDAFYIFGPEDGSLAKELLAHCEHVVYVPTRGCMNLAASVNVVLYDRMCKLEKDAVARRPVSENRDVNNNIKI